MSRAIHILLRIQVKLQQYDFVYIRECSVSWRTRALSDRGLHAMGTSTRYEFMRCCNFDFNSLYLASALSTFFWEMLRSARTKFVRMQFSASWVLIFCRSSTYRIHRRSRHFHELFSLVQRIRLCTLTSLRKILLSSSSVSSSFTLFIAGIAC